MNILEKIDDYLKEASFEMTGKEKVNFKRIIKSISKTGEAAYDESDPDLQRARTEFKKLLTVKKKKDKSGGYFTISFTPLGSQIAKEIG